IACAAEPSGPPPGQGALDVVLCNRFVPALRAASDKAFPAGWQPAQAFIAPVKPNGYSITLVLASAQPGIAMKVQVKLVKEQPINVRSQCAALAASVHAKASDCKVQPQGDAVLVLPVGPVVYDVRPDGTTVTVAANAP